MAAKKMLASIGPRMPLTMAISTCCCATVRIPVPPWWMLSLRIFLADAPKCANVGTSILAEKITPASELIPKAKRL